MIIERLEVGAFAENCYVVGCDKTSKGVVIDPGDEIQRILNKIKEHKLTIELILLTHAHFDHVKEVKAIQSSLQVPIFMHQKDQFLLDFLPVQAASYNLTTAGIPKIDRHIDEGETIKFGEIEFEILHTPGHSPGSITFFAENAAFSGDVLFSGSIGRTDLPGGDFDVLIESIKTKLYPLGDSMVIYPGHGPSTTIGDERKHNPFLNQN